MCVCLQNFSDALWLGRVSWQPRQNLRLKGCIVSVIGWFFLCVYLFHSSHYSHSITIFPTMLRYSEVAMTPWQNGTETKMSWSNFSVEEMNPRTSYDTMATCPTAATSTQCHPRSSRPTLSEGFTEKKQNNSSVSPWRTWEKQWLNMSAQSASPEKQTSFSKFSLH